jgi:hypothetical protein
MWFKQLITLTILGLSAVLTSELPIPAAAQEVSYPWCTEGSAFHCYYMNRQQCEETVDYHGFCVTNPDYRPQNDNARRRVSPQ